MLLPLILVCVISCLKLFPAVIEQYYSTGIYQKIASFCRLCTQWLPFSVGDIAYAIVLILLFIKIVKAVKITVKKQLTKSIFFKTSVWIVEQLCWIFIIFHVLWGLNYHRQGITAQLNLSKANYNKKQLELVVCDLVTNLNSLRKQISADSTLPNYSFAEITDTALAAYKNIHNQHSFLKYNNLSVKKSMYSGISHYLGFTGYYNPFSFEAQISTDLPNVLMPYVACHEMAHQLGYASEDEANFVGYLACSNSTNKYFKYSVYMDLYKYAALELWMQDFKTTHVRELDSLVRKDFKNVRRFFAKKENKVSPLISSMYNQYLLANNQKKGIDTYNDVVAFLISYRQKFGKI